MKWMLVVVLALCGCASKEVVQQPAAPPVYFKVDAATAATLSGEVRYKGKLDAPTVIHMDSDAECAKLYPGAPRKDAPIAVDARGGLANVLVYVDSGLDGKVFEPTAAPAHIDQKGCWFVPRVVGMMVNQAVEVTNSDPVTHNIHPQPKENREWNQSQAPGDAPLKRRFVRPEMVIPVKCNVHKWMRSWIAVLPHPYFAVTGVDGKFTIPNLPPGKYGVAVWHEKLGLQHQELTVAASGKATLQVEFSAL